jgi:hypothetical protein
MSPSRLAVFRPIYQLVRAAQKSTLLHEITSPQWLAVTGVT